MIQSNKSWQDCTAWGTVAGMTQFLNLLKAPFDLGLGCKG